VIIEDVDCGIQPQKDSTWEQGANNDTPDEGLNYVKDSQRILLLSVLETS
jgi:hypothetical protein